MKKMKTAIIGLAVSIALLLACFSPLAVTTGIIIANAEVEETQAVTLRDELTGNTLTTNILTHNDQIFLPLDVLADIAHDLPEGIESTTYRGIPYVSAYAASAHMDFAWRMDKGELVYALAAPVDAL